MTINFPDPKKYPFPQWVLVGDYFYYAKDILHFGGRLTTDNLRQAYRLGIFPWTIEGLPLPWFCPAKRAVLEFADLRVPKSLSRELKKKQYTYSIDRAFAQVIKLCASVKRSGEQGTWISDDFINTFTELHKQGDAHSVEVWAADDTLIGGLYGVDSGGVFCGESMFHLAPNTSKFALLYLITHLKSRGATWLDVQVMTPHFEKFGAKEIDRADFLEKLDTEAAKSLKLF